MEEMNVETVEKKLPSLENATPKELAFAIAEVLDSKKGHNIKVLYVEDKTPIADYFVLCTGNSSTQVKALAGEVEFKLEERGVKAYNVEGRGNDTWGVVDYSSVVVHIFSREARDFYNLDKLYGDTEPVLVFDN